MGQTHLHVSHHRDCETEMAPTEIEKLQNYTSHTIKLQAFCE